MVIVRITVLREPLQQLDLIQGLVKEVLVVLDHLLFIGCTNGRTKVEQRSSKRSATWRVVQLRIPWLKCCNIATTNSIAALLQC
eukprot:4689-Heterococcus_DN1.PRE.5